MYSLTVNDWRHGEDHSVLVIYNGIDWLVFDDREIRLQVTVTLREREEGEVGGRREGEREGGRVKEMKLKTNPIHLHKTPSFQQQ